MEWLIPSLRRCECGMDRLDLDRVGWALQMLVVRKVTLLSWWLFRGLLEPYSAAYFVEAERCLLMVRLFELGYSQVQLLVFYRYRFGMRVARGQLEGLRLRH